MVKEDVRGLPIREIIRRGRERFSGLLKGKKEEVGIGTQQQSDRSLLVGLGEARSTKGVGGQGDAYRKTLKREWNAAGKGGGYVLVALRRNGRMEVRNWVIPRPSKAAEKA